MRFGPDAAVPRHDFGTDAHPSEVVSADNLARWLANGEILAVDSRGIVFYAIYAFTEPPLRPLPAVRETWSRLI